MENIMEITQVKVRHIFTKEQSEKIRAIISVTFDNSFAVHDIKIIDGTERRFISMPNHRSADGRFQDIAHPINAEFRQTMETAIFTAYDEAIKEIGNNG